ncbi:alkaline phosphatase family protein [Lederbergia citrea]|uniref:alkaline phosphatase family protein n=1 Tax=Lederbergia citrea TaxID=2833581 RepID=UPI001BC9C71F|nr:alkaline phosphatase family protein [Lederbergia citrea]MBS4205616.1 alkaline phosphatase family protein [Lederbergia citrea]
MNIKTFLFTFILLIGLQLFSPSLFSAKENNPQTNIVISFDGMRYDFTKNYMQDGTLPHFKKVRDSGFFAENFRTIYPSLTATSHAAISTGALPEKTGMISNNLHKPGQKINEKNSSFFSPLDVTPIWTEAHKQGKTSATVLFPGSNPEEGNEATYSVYYGNTWAESALESLTFKRAESWSRLPKSYSPVKEATMAIKLKNDSNLKVHILAVDTSDNGKRDYDTYYFSTNKNTASAEIVKKNEWGSITMDLKDHPNIGFWFKLKETNGDLLHAELYRTAVTSAAIHGPSGFEEDISSRFGFLPIQDDDKALDENWITRKEYEEISERFAKWSTDVSLHIKEHYQPDLLMLYYPQIDHEEHKYLLVDPRQPGFSKKKSKRYMNYVQWSYELADKSLGEVLDSMNEKDRIFLVSDHGMEPVHSKISPNKELEKAGLLKISKDGKIDTASSKAYAVASGGIAHIYLNLKGREKDGIVSEEERSKLQSEIVGIFKGMKVKQNYFQKIKTIPYLYKDWWDGVKNKDTSLSETATAWGGMVKVLTNISESPFEQVIANGNNEKEMLDHKNAGDVMLIAAKGYYIAQDDDKTVNKADDLGNHGGDPKRRALQPIFFVAGNGFQKGTLRNHISTIDIAPTLYELMELDAPSFIDGKPIKQIVGQHK